MDRIVSFFLVLSLLACDPFHTRLDEDNVYYYSDDRKRASALFPDDTLKVMTWNIKFGGGRIDFFFDCHGDRVIMDSVEVFENLGSVTAFLLKTRPDVLFVQEIDVDSKRSAFIDQVEWILNHSHFNYAVYAPQWRATYIPSNGLGRMNSGNAVFSITPLFDVRRISLPLIGAQNFLVRYFYLKRNILHTRTVIDGDTLHLLNTHLSAYAADDTKKKQLEMTFSIMDSLDMKGQSFIGGGDFNALPPRTMKMKGFPDSVCEEEAFEADDYSRESGWMESFYRQFHSAVPIDQYDVSNDSFFTHTTDKSGFWNRKVDYIFSNQQPLESITFQSEENGGFETMHLSDHCPLMMKVGYLSL